MKEAGREHRIAAGKQRWGANTTPQNRNNDKGTACTGNTMERCRAGLREARQAMVMERRGGRGITLKMRAAEVSVGEEMPERRKKKDEE